MRRYVLLLGALLAGAAAIPSEAHGQQSPVPVKEPAWADTTNESPIYPVGDAVPVYRAVLDFIYVDGKARPSVIIMLDSAEGRMGGPCAFAKCLGDAWKHKSKMDTTTVLAFARFSRKRPGMRPFGYPIPIVFISYDDVRRMDADGRELLAAHPTPVDLPSRTWGLWAELRRKYPGAWGVTILSKVGFNKRYTEALVQAHQWCSDECRVHETLFLRRTKGRWRIVERIPEQVEPGWSPDGRYLGPLGRTPKESEIVPLDRPGVPTEATARTDVYRIVLDSLYSFNGERPKRIVLTNWYPVSTEIPPHNTAINPVLVKRFSIVGAFRAPFDAISGYRTAISTLPFDSVPTLRQRGTALDTDHTGYPIWVAFVNKYPGAWGMLGLSRIAFNASRSRALVSTYHACGNSCANRDTWFLTRSGKAWRIAERIPGLKENYVEVEPLRYLGVDVSPIAYRPRRVQGVVTNEVTGKPIPFLDIMVPRTLNSGINATDSTVRTDAAGRYTLTKLPLNTAMMMVVPCPGQQRPAQAKPIAVTPGMDTTINISVNFGVCDTTAITAPPEAPSPLSGAQAFIGGDSARFEFPRQSTDTYEWDVPLKGAYADSPEYMWDVGWQIADSLAGKAPYFLSLVQRWKAGGPRKGSLKQLISGVSLQPMIECTTCDGAVFEDPDTDHSNVFATIENGRLVFVVHGAEAVRRIFPRIPTTVTFTQTVRHTPLSQYGPGDVSSSQPVLVNCRNSNDSAGTKHRCDLKR